MSKYPEDIDKTASDIVLADYSKADEPDYTLYRAVAEAIFAERQRCAKAARERFTEETVSKTVKGKPYITGKAAIYAGSCIADLIEKGGRA